MKIPAHVHPAAALGSSIDIVTIVIVTIVTTVVAVVVSNRR